MNKEELRELLAELYADFWAQEEKKHGYYYNELSFSPDAFLRWIAEGRELHKGNGSYPPQQTINEI